VIGYKFKSIMTLLFNEIKEETPKDNNQLEIPGLKI
jgi:hypothetical protein